jgi:cold shock protein
MGESFAKKEKAKKKAKEKQDKAEKMRERKATNKGRSFEDMIAYLDEDGNIMSTPPDARMKREIKLEDIQLGAAAIPIEEIVRTGTVSFFNDAKGYGFITDEKTRENVFVHSNQLSAPVKEKDKVTFERERTQRGYSAINVKKLNK